MSDSGQSTRTRGGLSRRDMIKGAAAAGAVAWTAPVIIDSLTSPAAAFSGACTKYVVKLQPNGTVYPACFGGIQNTTCFAASDAKWAGTAPGTTSDACSASNPTFCPNGSGTATGRLPTVTSGVVLGGRTYYQVAFTGICGFSDQTDWQIGGRYEPGSPGSQYIKVTTACASSAGPTGASNGCYWSGTNTAWIPAFYSGSSGDDLNYIYLKYCCSS